MFGICSPLHFPKGLLSKIRAAWLKVTRKQMKYGSIRLEGGGYVMVGRRVWGEVTIFAKKVQAGLESIRAGHF